MWGEAYTTNDITVHAEYSGFLIYSIVYFFIVNFGIKVVYTSFYLKIYRDAVHEEEKMEKKAKLDLEREKSLGKDKKL